VFGADVGQTGRVSQVPPLPDVRIRPADAEDLEAVLELAETQRREYAAYQPVFWRPARQARAEQRHYLAGLLRNEDVLARVAINNGVVVGFIVGRLTAAPPVYDPGGTTCLVDDFAVAEPELWHTVGMELLGAVRDAAREQNAVQVVVITAHLDAAKRAALGAGGLSIASEWWVGPTR
jgi:hypothetical protein